MEKYDYFITPTAGTAAYRLDQPVPSEVGGKTVERFYDTILALYAITVTGLPAMSAPCGYNSQGLPVGFQIIGRRLREDQILEAAAVYAKACPQNFRMPSIDLKKIGAFAPEVESAPVEFIR
jgi:amidase